MSFAHLRNQSVTVYSKTGLDRYGKETVGTGTAYDVRHQDVSKTIFIRTGETIQILAIEYFPPEAVVEINDRVVYDGVSYKVWAKQYARGMNGRAHHIKVQLTQWLST